jgi:hypothetical protein
MAYSTLASIVHGEQRRLSFALGWIDDISSYTVNARVVEGDNDGAGTRPINEDNVSLTITTLPILNKSGNGFEVVLPANLIVGWDYAPTPDKPVYGYFDVEVIDSGVGDAQQIFKPVQGLIEIKYSPLESS